MRFQVPQFVDIEDKIIGPLTIKQFIIYVVGVLLLIPVFLATDLSLFLTIAIPSLGIAALFAHLKLNGKSLFGLMAGAAAFLTRGQVFLWQRTGTHMLPISGAVEAEAPDKKASLKERARALETAGNVVTEDAEDPMIKQKLEIGKEKSE